MRLSVFTGFILCVLLLSYEAQAGSWWDKAKTALNSNMGKSLTQSLEDGANAGNKLSNNKIGLGLREALEIGTKKVVGQLGVQNGFNLDPKIHIPLPKTLARVDSALSAIGMNGLTDDLELRINRAAEIATPKAKALFITAIKQMTIKDARQILSGPKDAATQYLRRTMGTGLEKEMQPLVQQALASAGAFQAYDSVIGRYDQIPFMPDVKADINDYVIEKAMDGIFYYVGQEEAAIRENPAKRTTQLLKAVFSSQ